ncbi:MAG TPA: preprotein translocase subunit SecG [Lentisphaeria bacterium]|nr:MAG: preprotein translocase subunit SecG [Lentisphaerae bacterium GWF2_49_21]HBC88253.1 preprotein translocase subunit SecG [Lentisphaeria bacterium]
MNDIIIAVLTVADVLIALLLICLILVQQSKDSGFGSAFGGLGEGVFGAQTGSHLAKMTVVFASLFLVITLSLAIITGHRKAPRSVVEQLESGKTETKTTAPAKTDAAPAAAKNTVSPAPVAPAPAAAPAIPADKPASEPVKAAPEKTDKPAAPAPTK